MTLANFFEISQCRSGEGLVARACNLSNALVVNGKCI
jgi:hypothetical protein